MTDIIRKYAELKAQIKKIEEDLKAKVDAYKELNDFESIENEALEYMLSEKQKTFPTQYGNVTVRETKSYEYPDWWIQETDKYKIEKKVLEKELKREGKYSVNVAIQLAGKPKELEIKPTNKKGTIH